MMALQKGILEKEDITEILSDFELERDEEGQLWITNPPTFSFLRPEGEEETSEEYN
jgi:hypothetical protein